MSDQNVMERSSRVQARRIKVDCEIAIRPPDAVEPVRVWRLYNMSMTGMFICADSLLSPGTLFSFEIRLPGDARPIEGKAQVVWVRQQSEGPSHQAGMGAHFHTLDEENQSLLRQMIESKQADSAPRLSPADQLRRVVEDALSDSTATGTAVATSPPSSQRPAERRPVARAARPLYGTSVAKSAKERRFSGWPVLILLLLALGAASFWLLTRGETPRPPVVASAPTEPATQPAVPIADSVEPRPARESTDQEPSSEPPAALSAADPAADLPGAIADSSTSAATTPANTEPASTDPATANPANAEPAITEVATAEPAAVAAEPPVPPITEARRAVEAWASAWSDQRVDDYLQAYASGFVPPRGMGRTQWEDYRRDRLTAPSFISVRLSRLGITRQTDDRAEAVFLQNYRSNTIEDMDEKTLELIWEEGSWRILSETSKPVS